MQWQLQSGEIIPRYSLTYLKNHVTPTSLVVGYSGYYKDLRVRAGDITKLITDRPSVTSGYYRLTKVQYNRERKQPWQPKFYIHLELLKTIQQGETK
jgi:hypothetical protein